MVQTEDGLKPIETLKVGDKVLSRDETTGLEAYRPVTQIFIETHEAILELDIVNDAGQPEAILTTALHPFYVEGLGFIHAQDIQLGAVLRTANGRVTLTAATWITGPQPAYNLEIEDFHTYFVGRSGVWVHNACDLGKIVPTKELETIKKSGLPERKWPTVGKLDDLKKVDLDDPAAIVGTIYNKKLQTEKMKQRFEGGATLLHVKPPGKVKPAGRTNMSEQGVGQYRVEGKIPPENIEVVK